MSLDEHPLPEQLRLLLGGRLDERQARSLTEHLESCESCLQAADALWKEESPLGEQGVEEPGPAEWRRIERSVFGRVHRTDFAESVACFGSRGFLLVILGLLKPMIGLLTHLRLDRRD